MPESFASASQRVWVALARYLCVEENSMRNGLLRRVVLCVCATFALLGISIAAFGQSDVGTITGFVRDQSGAVVPNATVTITSEATDEKHTVKTDADGHYTVTNLLPGNYTMDAEAPGFKKYESTHNTLQANSTVALDANLAVGQTSETVEVSATAEVLQTESGAVQAEVTAIEFLILNLIAGYLGLNGS